MAQQLPLLTPTASQKKRRQAPGRALAVVRGRPEELVEVAGADWRLDEHTKEVGKAGIAAARRALADAVGRSAA